MADINLTIDANASQAIKEIQSLAKDSAKSLKKIESNFDGLGSSVSGAFDVFAGTFGADLLLDSLKTLGSLTASTFGKMVSSARELETIAAQFETLTGSASSAQELLKDINEFAATTPFQLPGLASAAKQLLGFQFSQEQIIGTLQELGDVAAASGADINDLTLIYGQVAAAGKLTGERLLQLQERAIPIGPALAQTLGVAEESVKDLVSAGKVTTEVFQEAFSLLNDEGGVAFGGMAKRSQTLDGVLSTLDDNVNLFLASIGESLVPVLKEGASILTEFIQSIDTKKIKDFIKQGIKILITSLPDLIRIFKVLALAPGGFVVALNTGVIAIAQFVKAILEVDIVMNTVAATISAVTEAMFQIQKGVLSVQKAFAFIKGDLGTFKQLQKEIDETEEAIRLLGDASAESFTEDITGGLDDIINSALDFNDKVLPVLDGLDKGFEFVADAAEENIDRIVQASQAGGQAVQELDEQLEDLGTDNRVNIADIFTGAKEFAIEIGNKIKSAIQDLSTDEILVDGAKAFTTVLKGRKGVESAFSAAGAAAADAFVPGLGAAVGPLITELAKGPESAKAAIQEFAKAIPEVAVAIVEALAASADTIITALIDSLITNGGIERIIGAIIEAAPEIGFAITKGMVVGPTKAIGQRIAGAFGRSVDGLADELQRKLASGFDQFGKDLQTGLASSQKGLTSAGKTIGDEFNRAGEQLTKFLTDLPIKFRESGQELLNALRPSQIIARVKEAFIFGREKLFEAIFAIRDAFQNIIAQFTGLIERVASGFEQAGIRIREGFNSGLQIIRQFFTELPETFRTIATDFVVSIADGITQIITSIGDAGRALYDGFKAAFDEGIDSVTNFGRDAWNKFVEAFNEEIDAIIDELSIDFPKPGWVQELQDFFANLNPVGGSDGGPGGVVGDVVEFVTNPTSAIPGLANGGLVPSGFPNDGFNANLTSGELVTPAGTTQNLFRLIDQLSQGGGGESGPMVVQLQVGEKQLADVLLDINRRGFRTT